MKNIVLALSTCIFLTSCMTYKPDSTQIQKTGHNEVIYVYDPHYKKRPNAIGYGAMGLAAVGGGYLGYTADNGIFVRQDGDVRQPNRIANAATGALLGFATVNLTFHLSGMNKVKPSTNFQTWLNDTNNRSYVDCSEQLNSNLKKAIPRNMENTFKVSYINDVRMFYTAFGNSPRREEIFKQGVNVVKRTQIPELLLIDPRSIHVNAAKTRYFETSQTVTELLEAKQRFPETDFPTEKRASELVQSFSDAELFFKEFGAKSNYSNAVFDKVYPLCSIGETKKLVEIFPAAKNRGLAVERAISIAKNMADVETLVTIVGTNTSTLEKKAEEIVLADIDKAAENFDSFLKLFPKSSRLRSYYNQPYLGQWDERSKQPEGRGIYKSVDRTDIGYFSKGELHGENCLRIDPYPGGLLTETGRFQNGKLHGVGKRVYSSSNSSDIYDIYEGEFKDGLMHGQGKHCGIGVSHYFPYFMSDKVSNGCYTGGWEGDRPHGYGNLKSTTNEDGYIGNFANGFMNGNGTLFVGPFKLVGNFKGSSPNGNFEVTYNKFSGLPLIGGFFGEKTECYANSWFEMAPCMQYVFDVDIAKQKEYDDNRRRERENREQQKKLEEQQREQEKKMEKQRQEAEKKFSDCVADIERRIEYEGVVKQTFFGFNTGAVEADAYKIRGRSEKLLFNRIDKKWWVETSGLLVSNGGPYSSRQEAIAKFFCKN